MQSSAANWFGRFIRHGCIWFVGVVWVAWIDGSRLFAVDPDAATYGEYRGLAQASTERVSGFVTTLKAANLWSNLTEAILARTNYNAPIPELIGSWHSNPPTLTGTGFTYGQGNRGLKVYGPNTRLDFYGLDLGKTNTIVVQGRRIKNPGTEGVGNTLFGIFNSGGEYLGIGENQGLQYAFYDLGAVASGYLYNHATTTFRTNSQTLILALAEDEHGVYGWADGHGAGHAASPAYPSHFLAPGFPLTNQLTSFRIGFLSPDSWTGFELDYALFFNRLLTTEEVRAAGDALRWLDEEEENIVLYGDSRITPFGMRNNALLLEQQPVGAYARILEDGWYFYKAATLAQPDFLATLDHYRPTGSTGPVARSTLVYLCGYNDASEGSNAPALWRDYTKVAGYAQARGYRVLACTLSDYFYFAELGVFYEMLRTNEWARDDIIPMEELFPNPHSPNYYTDGLHYTEQAARVFAQYVSRLELPRPRLSLRSVAGTNILRWVTDETGLVLESSAGLGLEADWGAVTANVSVTGSTNEVLLEAASGTRRFFRLRRP